MRTLALAVLMLLLAGCGPDIPTKTREFLESADAYELLSLDPTDSNTKVIGEFYGRRVIGRTTITDPATQKRLNDALRQGARDDAPPAACFEPRHGISILNRGSLTDLVICFECHSVEVYRNGQKLQGFTTSDAPQSTFDAVLKSAGVPLAEKSN